MRTYCLLVLWKPQGYIPLRLPCGQLYMPDNCFWADSPNGGISVSSAYELLMRDEWDVQDGKWNLAWKWPGIQRIKSFLAFGWFFIIGYSSPTRKGCADTWRITATARCAHGEEDINHVLRECPFAVDCWTIIIPHAQLPGRDSSGCLLMTGWVRI